jgi:cytochrome c
MIREGEMRWSGGLATITLACSLGFAQTDNSAQAEILVKEAVSFARQQGKEKLLEATNFPSGRFHLKKGDALYLFIYNTNGFCVAHGARAQLVGMNRYDAKDPDGRYYVREFVNIAKSKGKGWTSYKYPDPKTGKVETKTTFVSPARGPDHLRGLLSGMNVGRQRGPLALGNCDESHPAVRLG